MSTACPQTLTRRSVLSVRKRPERGAAWVEGGVTPGSVIVTCEETELELAEMMREATPQGATDAEDITAWRDPATYTPGRKASCDWHGTALVRE